MQDRTNRGIKLKEKGERRRRDVYDDEDLNK